MSNAAESLRKMMTKKRPSDLGLETSVVNMGETVGQNGDHIQVQNKGAQGDERGGLREDASPFPTSHPGVNVHGCRRGDRQAEGKRQKAEDKGSR